MKIIIKPSGVALLLAAFGGLTWVAVSNSRVAASQATHTPPKREEQAVPRSPSLTLLQNGDMEVGGDVPESWENIWTGAGELRVVRDAETHGSGSSSLRLESVGGSAAYGSVTQDLPEVTPGQTITVTASGRAEGVLDEAYIALQVFDPTFKEQFDFAAIADKKVLMGNAGFAARTREITLPNKPCVARIVVLLKGRGKIWADDISVTATK